MQDPQYLISQILVIIGYISIAFTYVVKTKKLTIWLNFGYLGLVMISYFLLSAYSGMAMLLLAIVRNTIFLFRDKDGKPNTKLDVFILVGLIALMVVVGSFTATEFLGFFSVIATAIYTYGLWQKSRKLYRFIGIFSSSFWIVYNVYVGSIFAIILESCITVTAFTFFILEVVKDKKQKAISTTQTVE